MTRTTYALALLAISAALAIAGCGSSNDESGSAYGGKSGSTGKATTTTAKSPPGADSGAAVLTVANAQNVGPVLVDAKGFTVYVFHKDEGTTSTCYGGCAITWPPLLTKGAPQTGEGAEPGKVGTTKRKDGTMQVTYAGHPLYLFTQDKKPGEANGNDLTAFLGEWYAVQKSGADAEG